MKLFPHQQELLNNIRNSFINGYRSPCIVAPCGFGKSVIIGQIIKNITDKKQYILFLIHREELKEQIAQTLKQFSVDMRFVQLGMVQSVVRRLERGHPP